MAIVIATGLVVLSVVHYNKLVAQLKYLLSSILQLWVFISHDTSRQKCMATRCDTIWMGELLNGNRGLGNTCRVLDYLVRVYNWMQAVEIIKRI